MPRMTKTFKCPICKKEIEIMNSYTNYMNDEEFNKLKLLNKIFHMKQHKIVNTYENKINILEARLRDLKWKYEYAKMAIGVNK
jgi:hypothetical protein